MVRAAAKNHDSVGVVVDPADYDGILDELRRSGALSTATKVRLARHAFAHTAGYDAAPDIGQLAAGIEREMARLVALSQDSVLLFSKDHRRKRSSRSLPHRVQQVRVSRPERA